MNEPRPSWNRYFMEMAFLASRRSTCLRRRVGAVIVRDHQILSTGYNGAPKHTPHCAQTGCLRAKMNVPSGQMHELCRGVHAEQNAIVQAAVNGVSLKQAELYCTTQPCVICTKMIINAEIKTIYMAEDYPDELARELLKQAGLNVLIYDMENDRVNPAW